MRGNVAVVITDGLPPPLPSGTGAGADVGAASGEGAAAEVGGAAAGGGLAGAQLAIAASRAAVASAAPLSAVRRGAAGCVVDVPVGTGRSLMAHPDTPC
jgi:hypothetical protein